MSKYAKFIGECKNRVRIKYFDLFDIKRKDLDIEEFLEMRTFLVNESLQVRSPLNNGENISILRDISVYISIFHTAQRIAILSYTHRKVLRFGCGMLFATGSLNRIFGKI